MAGMAGFEPANAGVKVPCLTAWLHPNIKMRNASTTATNCSFLLGNRAVFSQPSHIVNRCRTSRHMAQMAGLVTYRILGSILMPIHLQVISRS